MVSIITVNYNGLSLTLEMISSVFKHIKTPFELIVVDNGSEKNEAIIIISKEPKVISLRSEKNLGFAGANNLGIKHAKGKYFLLMNNDTIIKDDILPPLLNRFTQSEDIGAVGPKICFAQSPRLIQFAGYTTLTKISLRNQLIGYKEQDHGQYDKPKKTPYLLGAAMMISRKAVEKVGLMSEIYFLYYEELDWCEAIRNAGFELWYEPKAIVFHKGSATMGGKNSPLRTYYIMRNRFLFAKRNLKTPYRWLSYGFQLGISLPKECIKHLIMGNPKLSWVCIIAAKNFFTQNYSSVKL